MVKSIRTILMECLESNENGETMRMEMAKGLINKAISGDVKAFEAVAKFVGEFPNKQEMVETDIEIKRNTISFS